MFIIKIISKNKESFISDDIDFETNNRGRARQFNGITEAKERLKIIKQLRKRKQTTYQYEKIN